MTLNSRHAIYQGLLCPALPCLSSCRERSENGGCLRWYDSVKHRRETVETAPRHLGPPMPQVLSLTAILSFVKALARFARFHAAFTGFIGD